MKNLGDEHYCLTDSSHDPVLAGFSPPVLKLGQLDLGWAIRVCISIVPPDRVVLATFANPRSWEMVGIFPAGFVVLGLAVVVNLFLLLSVP
jgi:hypothetical protein